MIDTIVAHDSCIVLNEVRLMEGYTSIRDDYRCLLCFRGP